MHVLFVFIRFMLVCLTFSKADSLILRLACSTSADFTVFEVGWSLEGSVLSQIKSTYDTKCMVECARHPKCKSYNIENDNGICELNSKIAGEDGKLLVQRPGWVYKSTDYNETLINLKLLKAAGNFTLKSTMDFTQFMKFMLVCLAFSKADSLILRLPCSTSADFTIFEVGWSLEGSLLSQIKNTYDTKCMVECVQHPKCKSYNIENDNGICELNSKIAGEDGKLLVQRPGWVYKSTDYNETLVGTTCKKLNPCPLGILCRDTCEAPFYECVYCDKKHYGLHCDKIQDSDDCASSTCLNGGSCTDLVADYSCTCAAGYTGRNCESPINECLSLPCFNEGTCMDLQNQYQCTCALGYTGTQCETEIDECATMPCQNGGTCQDRMNGFSCTCTPGYTGATCLTNIDECQSNPCLNGAACQDEVNAFYCQCASGYTGTTCSVDINECSSNPCINGGTCSDHVNSYSCQCSPGFSGPRCATNNNECQSGPCQNGGSCIDGINMYTCNCAAGFTGVTCAEDINECLSNPCQNGGACENRINSYDCVCSSGYHGEMCQYVDACASDPCQNGGTCVNYDSSYYCYCDYPYDGTNCASDSSTSNRRRRQRRRILFAFG